MSPPHGANGHAANGAGDSNPDAWVPRNPAAWRHGKWNQETPMDLLEVSGFSTPNDL